MLDLSIVIPLYNEEESLPELTDKLHQTMEKMQISYEIIFVDDGSSDHSYDVLHQLHQKHPEVKIIQFRTNYGKSAALSVGFKHAQGDIIVTMDADLQDDPEEISRLLAKIYSGFDLVSGWKKVRHDPISKTIPSKLFNGVVSLLTGIKIHDFNCGLKAYRRTVTRDIKVYGELHRFLPALAHWQGYRVGEIEVKHHPRKFGISKFGMGRFWSGFVDFVTVLFITRFSKRPLHLFGVWGFGLSVLGFLTLLYLTVLWFYGEPIKNRPLFFLAILLLIVGMQFVSLGLLGEMITHSSQKEAEYSVKNQIL
jgi:glycosyltransferase involved in cell wall biosynthesis